MLKRVQMPNFTSGWMGCTLLVLILAACAPVTPAPAVQPTAVIVPATVTPVPTVQPTTAIVPTTGTLVLTATAAPTTLPTATGSPADQPTSPGGSMPMLRDISWKTAQEMILSGQVKAVSQSHSLQVSLTLKDGRVLHTVEPHIDDVISMVKQCGDTCRDILIATE